jgi:Tfp pilus assembly protein PilP
MKSLFTIASLVFFSAFANAKPIARDYLESVEIDDLKLIRTYSNKCSHATFIDKKSRHIFAIKGTKIGKIYKVENITAQGVFLKNVNNSDIIFVKKAPEIDRDFFGEIKENEEGKNVLQFFNLRDLKLIKIETAPCARVWFQDPEGYVHVAPKEAPVIGRNYGKILEMGRDSILIGELYRDGEGDWEERKVWVKVESANKRRVDKGEGRDLPARESKEP